MSINPKTLPDGTVVEFGAPGGNRATGYIHSGGIWEHDGTRDWGDEMLGSGADYGMVVTRTFSPDPTPDQEVPREEWANIKPGSRVRIVDSVYDFSCEFVVEWVTGVKYVSAYGGGGMSFRLDAPARNRRVYLLDEPADPDTDLIEAMAAVLSDYYHYKADDWQGYARAALRVVREREAKS